MKRKFIVLTLTGMMVLSTVLFSGCTQSNDDKQAQQTEQLQAQASSKIGMPNIKNFYEKQTLKTIIEECDKSNLITYTYVKSEMTGKFTYLGESMGYGVPYGSEYTNPEYIPGNTYTGTALPQADPNGLYKATNVSATWIILIDTVTKQAKPVYIESNITVSQFKLPRNIVDPSTLPSDY